MNERIKRNISTRTLEYILRMAKLHAHVMRDLPAYNQAAELFQSE